MKDIIESELSVLAEDFLSNSKKMGNTFKAYKSDLRLFLERFDNLSSLNDSHRLRDIRLELLNEYSQRTAVRKWSVLREFLGYCQSRGLLRRNEISKLSIELIHEQRKVKNLDQKMLELICNAPENARDKALLWFLYSTGSRVSELLKFGYLKNLNLAKREFLLPNRTCFLCAKSAKFLKEYLEEREEEERTVLNLRDPIFTSEKNEMLGENFLYILFAKYAKQVGIKANLKDLRDSLAHRLLSSGATPEQIVYMLGFKSVKSVEVYLK